MSEQQVIECGKCGNTNLIPEGRSQFYCQYCGSRIILKPTVSEEQAGRVENYLRMARATSNYHHAYEYYSRAITIDSSRPEIWASRGKLAQRIREMIGDFRMAIELDPGNQALIDELAFFAFDKIKRSSLYSFWDLKWVLHYNRSPDVLLFAIESLQPGVEESIKSGGDSEDLIPFYDGLVKEFKQTYPIKAREVDEQREKAAKKNKSMRVKGSLFQNSEELTRSIEEGDRNRAALYAAHLVSVFFLPTLLSILFYIVFKNILVVSVGPAIGALAAVLLFNASRSGTGGYALHEAPSITAMIAILGLIIGLLFHAAAWALEFDRSVPFVAVGIFASAYVLVSRLLMKSESED